MEVLQWVFVIGISATILSMFLTLYSLISFVLLGKKNKELLTKKSRSRRKNSKQKEILEFTQMSKKNALRKCIVFFVFSLLFSGVSYYVTYYQSTNLSNEDTQHIIDAYYYVRDLQDELNSIKEGAVEEGTSNETVSFVATSLAGYATKKASTLNTVEGQTILNRYYSSMSELGINVSRQKAKIYSKPEIVTELLSDVDKTLTYQKKAFGYFKVNEAALKAEK